MDFYYRDEIEEAIEAAEVAIDKLEEAKNQLKKASGWGIFDLLGGGLIASVIKRDRMKDSQYCLEEAKDALSALGDELGDLDVEELNLNLNDFVSFTDLFFDNIFSDFATQRRISDAIYQIDDVLERVSDVRLMLINKLDDYDY